MKISTWYFLCPCQSHAGIGYPSIWDGLCGTISNQKGFKRVARGHIHVWNKCAMLWVFVVFFVCMNKCVWTERSYEARTRHSSKQVPLCVQHVWFFNFFCANTSKLVAYGNPSWAHAWTNVHKCTKTFLPSGWPYGSLNYGCCMFPRSFNEIYIMENTEK